MAGMWPLGNWGTDWNESCHHSCHLQDTSGWSSVGTTVLANNFTKFCVTISESQ